MKSHQSGNAKLIPVFAIVLIGAAAWAMSSGILTQQEQEALGGVRVARGQLGISEIVTGNLEAKDSVSLMCELEGNSTILYLIDEGSIVDEGDLIAELDVSEMTDRRVAQEITVKNSEAAETKAREQYDIQEIQNESDIASAELRVTFARIDKEKYIKGDWPLQKQAAIESIQLRKEEYKRANDELEWTTKLEAKGFVQRTELEADRLAHERAKIAQEQAIREQELMLQYENPRRLAELDADIEELDRDLQKTGKQANAQLADFLAAKETAVARLGLEREKLAKILSQIDKGVIIAPGPGMVVYGRNSSRYGSSEPVQVGSSVRERQEIVSLPKPGGMVVKASLHETVLEMVEVGQPCRVTIDAMRKEVFSGRVEFVALLPDSQKWFANPNQRLYKAEISIESGTPEMRPGMSCHVEIFAAALDDVLYAPVQSIFIDGGKTIVFKETEEGFQTTQVETGLDNAKWVEIIDGVEEGDVVSLTPPSSFSPSATPQENGGGIPAMAFPASTGESEGPAGSYGADRPTSGDSEASPHSYGAKSKPSAGGGSKDSRGGGEGRRSSKSGAEGKERGRTGGDGK
ncbi:MAG: HlyD family secretion protein [Planctomycetota bacterium]|jgi:HlyD family secretion protein